jgi:hypothetical protein
VTVYLTRRNKNHDKVFMKHRLSKQMMDGVTISSLTVKLIFTGIYSGHHRKVQNQEDAMLVGHKVIENHHESTTNNHPR